MSRERAGRLARRFSWVLLVSGFGACAAEPPVSNEPVVFPFPAPPSARDAAFLEALERVTRRARDGDMAEAARQLEALRAGDVPETYRSSVSAVGDWIAALEVERDLGAASRIDLDGRDVTAGDAILARVMLRNPGPRAVHFQSSSRHADEPRGVLLVARREWGPLGSREEVSYPVPFEPPEGILPPGGSTSTEIPIETPASAPFSLMEIEIAATLFPAHVVADGRPVPVRRIHVPPVRVRVFPAGWERLATAPLDSLRRALLAGSPAFDRHVLTAAALVAPPDKEEAMGICITALDETNARRQASAMAALQYLSGRTDLPFEPTVWRRWWRLRGEGEEGRG